MSEAGERGRPSLYSQEIAAEICRRLANGESLRSVCRDENMPAESTVRLWHVEDREGFSAQYTRAREAQALLYADEIVDISDDGTNDWLRREGKDGEDSWTANGEHIQRSRLRVDTRKWILSKVLPKVYGDKTELTGKDGAALIPEESSTRDLAKAILSILGKGVTSPGGS